MSKSPAATWWEAFRGENHGAEAALDRELAALPGFESLKSSSGMVSLAGRVAKTIVTPPFSWFGDTIVETSRALRAAFWPVMIAATVYAVGFGSVLFGPIIYALGAPDRLAPGLHTGIMREVGTWITFMIIAANLGASLAGDLGARKIREELDALDVLGVDKIRNLIVPRVIAITVTGTILALLSVVCIEFFEFLMNTQTVHQTFGAQLSTVQLSFSTYDLFASIGKHLIIGFFIGVVACYKGLNARGGAEGVGRAVNQTVVISFFGLWLIDIIWNTAYLTLFPQILDIRG
jgi:phospholipid/cholesterol/gamma-HCH transport system permease protein